MSDQILDAGAEAKTTERPTFLTVLCILTFIGSGLGVLSYLLLTIAFGAMASTLSSIPGMDALMSGGIAFFAIALILAGVSLFGAIQMWKLKKNGFYMYVGANVIAFILPLVMIEGMPFSTLGLVFLAGWIAMYAANLKHMN